MSAFYFLRLLIVLIGSCYLVNGRVYQLKKTSDYSQIHLPGPGQNLKKKYEHFDEIFPLRPAACRRRIFLAKIAFLWEKHNFPRLAACRRRFFIVKNANFWVAGAARREHKSSFPKNTRISPIETSFVKLCSRRAAVPSMTGTK